jgi:hypothetical protein
MITSLTDDADDLPRGRGRLTAPRPIPGTPLADRVLIISARLARAEMFVDMDVIEAVLAADRQITAEEQGPQIGAATGVRRQPGIPARPAPGPGRRRSSGSSHDPAGRPGCCVRAAGRIRNRRSVGCTLPRVQLEHLDLPGQCGAAARRWPAVRQESLTTTEGV